MSIFVIIFRIVFIVFFFGFCVFIHEFGHLLVALWQGLKVEKFSIGFGPKICGFNWRGVEFVVSWLPFGGYVMLPQLDPVEEPVTTKGEKLPLSSPRARGYTAFAGPFFNILFGFVLATIMCFVGLWQSPVSNSVIVHEVPVVLPVASGNLNKDSRILAVNDCQLSEPMTWEEWCYSEESKEILTAWSETDRENGLQLSVEQLEGGNANIEFKPEINPEWEAGLRNGDRIIKIGDKGFSGGLEEFRNEYLFASGGAVRLTVADGGKLSDKREISYIPAPNPVFENLGAPFFIMTDAVTICRVVPGSVADKIFGLKDGDQLVSINDENVTSVRWLSNYLQDGKLVPGSQLGIDRDGQHLEITGCGWDGSIVSFHDWGLEFNITVDYVVEDGPAAAAGMKDGDKIIAIDGVEVCAKEEVTDLIRQSDGRTMRFDCRRQGEKIEIAVTPAMMDGIWRIGTVLSDVPGKIIGHPSPWRQFSNVAAMTGRTLGLLFSPLTRRVKNAFSAENAPAPRAGVHLRHMSGPLGIIGMLWQKIKIEGLRGGMSFIILITFSLAFMNLLPLPVLDGGHIVCAIIEGVTGHRLPVKFIRILTEVFGYLLIALMLYITFFDGMRMWNLFVR